MERVTQTCKYGHGELQRLPDAWSVQQAVPKGERSAHGERYMLTGMGFVLSMYRCPTCGYVELFDDEDVV